MSQTPSCNLQSVIFTEELEGRRGGADETARVGEATVDFAWKLSGAAPLDLFPQLVQAILDCTNGESAGVSLFCKERNAFVWPAVAGGLASYVGGGTPRDFGPCGVVLDRDAPVLFQHPERYFTYLEPIRPPLEEVLLAPFHVNGEAVGTVWAVIHQAGKQFEPVDRRLLENFSEAAATVYRLLDERGELQSQLDVVPVG